MQTQLDIADGTEPIGPTRIGRVGHHCTVYVQIAQRQVGGGQIADQLARTCIARGIEDRPPQHHHIVDIAHRRQARTTPHGFIQRIDREVQAAHFQYAEQQREHQQTNDGELHRIGAAHMFSIHHRALITVVATSGMPSAI
ncbi:hypothetical protein D3C81_1569510 [compost metagenome]